MAFLSTPTPSGIHSIVIDDPRAATQKGVGIGNPLAAARRAYPTLRCHEGAPLGESYLPAHCSGKLAEDRYIWFGNDPIRVIALSPAPMGKRFARDPHRRHRRSAVIAVRSCGRYGPRT